MIDAPMNRRRMIGVTSAAAAGVAAAAFALPARTAVGQTLPVVRVGASLAATQAEAYYADQLGYFKAAGIAATLTPATRSAETLSAVARGDLDFASATAEGIANAIIHDIPIRMVATGTIYVEPAPIGFFVAKNSAVKSPLDLESAVVGVNSLNDSQSLGLWAWLEQNHLDTTKVKFLEIPFATMAAALKRGDIAGCCMVEPFMSAAADDVRAIPGVYASLGRHWALGTWYARADFMSKNPTLVQSFVSAIYATAKHVNANQASIDSLLATYSKVTLDTLKTMVKPVWAERAERTNVEPQLQIAAKYKVISRPVSYEELTGS